jgi:hypothetical protein
MFAHIATFEPGPEPDSVAVAVLDEAREHSGFVGGYALSLIGLPRGLIVTLWDAAAAVPGAGPDTYVVDSEWTGRDGGPAPVAASIVSFDGPISAELQAASDFAAEHRVVPAITAVPGTIHGFAMWDPDLRARRVLTLASSVEAIEAVGRAVNATELLPGEDRALLPGPDRVEIYRVIAAYTPAPRR